MNQAQIQEQKSADPFDSDSISFIELVITLARNKKAIIGIPVIAGALSVALSFAFPNVYKGTTKLLPPQQAQSGALGLLSQLGGVAGMAAGVSGLKNPNDMYLAMLKSTTVADKLIAQFDLKKVYDTDSQEKARKYLEDNTAISSGKDGLITIEVEDKNQKLVARLANAYVEQLVQLTRSLAVTEASQRRVFFEQQLELAKNNLAVAETKLKGALDKSGVISVDAESRSVLETGVRIKAQISAKEIQLNSMRAFVTATHPDFRRVEEELASLRRQLSSLENGSNGSSSGDAINAGAEGKQPGLQSIKLLRDVKYYQMLYELLAKQYEVARLDEAKDASLIQVLDPALEPERKFKPKRLVILVLSSMIALFGVVFWAIFKEMRSRAMRSPTKVAQWNKLAAELKLRKR
jgi:uncharacterized protein involved in exopolysaccharide biosynthesis